LAYPFTSKAKLGCGTVAYHSPEQLLGKVYDSSVDMFALGIVTYTMLLGDHPFLSQGKLDIEKLKVANWAILQNKKISK
jgi:serine/threonine protein kinase